MVLGKWFRKRVAESLADDVIPDTARVVEKPIRRAGATAESAGTTISGGDVGGMQQIEHSGGAVSPPAVRDGVSPGDPSSVGFSQAMSGQQVRETLAELLGDRRAADIAALPVNHGLRTSGKDGVRLFYTPATGGNGSTVTGWVEEARIPQGGILEDHWSGTRVGEFEFSRPADGATPSWSARLTGDRKRIGRTAEQLPEDLAGVAPGFDAAQIRSTVTDAVARMSKDKLARRGGALDVEAQGDQLIVRASAGVLPPAMTPRDCILLDSTLTRTDIA